MANAALFIVINMFAGCFQGIVGLGHALIATPLSLTFLDKGTTFTAIAVSGSVLNGYLSRKIKAPLDTKIFKPLLIGCIIGMPFGVVVLKTIPINTLRIALGTLSILLVPVILFAKVKITNLKVATPLTGVIAGVLQTSTSMTGPPVTLLLTGADVPKNSMRKLLVTFFFAISVITLPMYAVGRLLTWPGIVLGLIVVPFIVVAGHVGNKVSEYIPHHWYRVLALGTISVTGAFAIYSGLHH